MIRYEFTQILPQDSRLEILNAESYTFYVYNTQYELYGYLYNKEQFYLLTKDKKIYAMKQDNNCLLYQLNSSLVVKKKILLEQNARLKEPAISMASHDNAIYLASASEIIEITQDGKFVKQITEANILLESFNTLSLVEKHRLQITSIAYINGSLFIGIKVEEDCYILLYKDKIMNIHFIEEIENIIDIVEWRNKTLILVNTKQNELYLCKCEIEEYDEDFEAMEKVQLNLAIAVEELVKAIENDQQEWSMFCINTKKSLIHWLKIEDDSIFKWKKLLRKK